MCFVVRVDLGYIRQGKGGCQCSTKTLQMICYAAFPVYRGSWASRRDGPTTWPKPRKFRLSRWARVGWRENRLCVGTLKSWRPPMCDRSHLSQPRQHLLRVLNFLSAEEVFHKHRISKVRA